MRTASCCLGGLVALAACSHAGAGEGTLETAATATSGGENEGPVTFQWQSKPNATDGAIQAKLPDGTAFDGTYLQMTSQASARDYAVYYSAWGDPVWGDPWYAGPTTGFSTRYSGRVVAHLHAQNGERMRCTFNLREPVSGMNGGGIGDCQLSTKQTVFAARIAPGD
jgi:hypothetical protein